MTDAVALSRKPSQKRREKIICPMCETVGYAPVAASGKDVRCPNRKCMVPVFTAPDFAAPKREEIEKPSSKGTVLVIVAVAVVVSGAGFAYWWTNFRVRQSPSQKPVAANGTDGAEDQIPEGTNPNKDPADADSTKPRQEEPDPIATVAEVRRRAFAQWPKLTSTIVDLDRRPLRLRYAAESYAIAGDVKTARSMIGEFEAGEHAFYRIGPLVEIAWAQAAAGADNATTVSALQGLASQIPTRGFDPARNVILYAAAIAAHAEATGQARELVGSRRDNPSGERLLARLQAAASLANHDLDANFRWRPVLAWSHPKSVAVAFNLARHGRLDAALQWGQQASGRQAQAETIAAWGEARVAADSGSTAAIGQAVEGLDPAAALYVLSRAGVRAIAEGEESAAKSLLAPIKAAAEQIAASDPLSATSASQLHKIDLADAASERLRGAAFAEAAHLAALLDKTELAATYLWRGVDHLRAAAPPLAEVAARMQEFATVGLAGIRGVLKSELDLSEAAAEDAATEYRRNLSRFRDAAARARAGRAAILSRGIAWGLGEALLPEIEAGNKQDGSLLAGKAGGRILAAFERSGEAQAAKALRQAGVREEQIPPLEKMQSAVWSLIEQEKFQEAGRELQADDWEQLPEAQRLALAMRVVTRLARDGDQTGIGEFLATISPGNRLLLYRRWGAAAAAARAGMAFLDELQQRPITTKAAALRGMAAGLASLPASSKTADKKPADAGKKESAT